MWHYSRKRAPIQCDVFWAGWAIAWTVMCIGGFALHLSYRMLMGPLLWASDNSKTINRVHIMHGQQEERNTSSVHIGR